MRPSSPAIILKSASVRAFLVSNLTNIRYLSGVEVSTGFVLIKAKTTILFVDGRYLEAAKKSARKGVKVQGLERLEAAMKSTKECGYESEDVTVDRFRRWKRKFTNTKFVQRRGIIEEFRRSKNPDEITNFKKAQRITHEMMARVPSMLKRSITEQQLAWKLEEWARELGAEGLSFDPIVAFGSHSSSPHHHPTTRKLKKGHIVQIDVGARVKGYCPDQSAVFFTSKKTPLQKRVYDAVARAKSESESAIKEGVTNHELDKIARDILKEAKLEKYFIHSLGHGVGLDIHEGATLSGKAKKIKLLKNEIITIEPGVYIPGKFGIRLEDEKIVS